MSLSHHCRDCGARVDADGHCPEHPGAIVETVSSALARLETITARYNAGNTTPNPKRIERLARAVELGADDKALEALCDAKRTSTESTIVLPVQRFENLSRGKGWCRKGRGSAAEWGERDDGGYRVGPGRWTVGGNDGFSRKGEDTWTVKHVQVGAEIWTVAS